MGKLPGNRPDNAIDLGEPGKRSIRLFLSEAESKGLIPAVGEVEFVD